MERSTPFLLDLWREAGRHAEIEPVIARLAPRLAERMPVDLVLVRRIDLRRSRLETIATALCRPGATRPAPRSDLSADELQALLAWCREGTPVHRRARDLASWLPGLLPAGVGGDVLAGPLQANEEALGALLLVARPPRRFDAAHERALATMLEPMAASLESDRRLHEIAASREAAEADRNALLTRLGRREVGETLVGADLGLRPVLERLERVAPLDVPVLLLGETGSGKEVIARTIHARSRRADGPFHRVNCGAIPPGLIDSELFGHERGSFTGATGERRGWFERADGGTLFLDEIGELPLEAQVRLLRVLQDGALERVGGQRALAVDVRLVAATHRDLHAMVSAGRFREDLWYRIAVFPIHLPPLRDRVEDVPALATHFALRAAKRFGTPPCVPTPEDLDLLVRYAWPGNVRELIAVMERAVILGDGRALAVERALGPVPGGEREGVSPHAEAPHATPGRVDLPDPRAPAAQPAIAAEAPFPTLDVAMARHIEAALARTGGRVEGRRGAAALLGINPHTLRARMRKLGVEWRRFRESDAPQPHPATRGATRRPRLG